MALPKIFKSPYFLGGTGICVAGITGVCLLAGKGHLKGDKHDPHWPTPISFQENRCFLSLFNIDLPFGEPSSNGPTDEDFAKAKKKIEFPGLDAKSKTEGCLSMTLSSDLNLSAPTWAFNLGFAAKSDRVGLALYVDGLGGNNANPDSPKYSQFLKYSLLLLFRENESWNIKAGYEWKDNEISGNVLNFYVSDIEGQNWIDAGTKEKSKGYVYKGAWHYVDDDGGSKMFGKMELKGKKSNHSLILGRKKSFREHVDGWRLFLSGVYMEDKNSWFDHKDPNFDLGDVMETWFSPFANKKGKWLDWNSWCAVDDNKDKSECTVDSFGEEGE